MINLPHANCRYMNSRREFLEASSMVLAACVSEAGPLPQKAKRDSVSQSSARRDYWNDLPNYLIAKVEAARVKRKSELAKVRSSAEADARGSFIRTKVWELIGGEL